MTVQKHFQIEIHTYDESDPPVKTDSFTKLADADLGAALTI